MLNTPKTFLLFKLVVHSHHAIPQTFEPEGLSSHLHRLCCGTTTCLSPIWAISLVSNSFSQWSRTLSGKLFTTQTTRGFGDMGAPVQIPAALQGESQASFTKHQFNLVASNLIGLSRALPDYRNERCVNITLSDRLAALKTSVIIVFHNEAWSTLLRTVNSVIERTPRPLLHEIILVDDASTESKCLTRVSGKLALDLAYHYLRVRST
ncbi:unnamed protein product [Dicrocoelium dendriticum]|nr:unnamed protein product [Dicrocoelium dendriticum]